MYIRKLQRNITEEKNIKIWKNLYYHIQIKKIQKNKLDIKNKKRKSNFFESNFSDPENLEICDRFNKIESKKIKNLKFNTNITFEFYNKKKKEFLSKFEKFNTISLIKKNIPK